MNRRILLVDDDALVLSGYQRTLRNRFSLDTALGGEEALTHIRAHGPPAVLVADMQMPGMSGLDLLMKVERMSPIGYLAMPASLIEKCRDNQPLTPVGWGLLERLM